MALESYLAAWMTLAGPLDPPPEPWDVASFPAVLTTFGGGSRTDKRIGVLGGDVLVGWSTLLGNKRHNLVFTPTLGWSGWRTFDEPSFRADTFTGRFDFGYMNFQVFQGITVFGAGRVGSGRQLDPYTGPSLLYGAQLGATYWPYTGWWLNAGVIGLEYQWNHTNYLGPWHNEMRLVLNVNAAVVLHLITWAMNR